MKELSTEEKAKRYNEALDNAKVVYKTIRKDLKPVIGQIFPELEVSDDERIRAEIEQFLKLHNVLNKEWLDWLGKQGKETSWKPSKEEMDALYGIEDDVRRRSTIQVLEYARSLDTYNQYGKADIDKNIAWLEKQGDANKEYWRGYREGREEILDKYAELEKQGKQNIIWKPTEEQIEALEHLLETIRRHEYSYFHEEKFLLLHSLLEQLKEL